MAEERVGGMRASAASICLLLPLGKKIYLGGRTEGNRKRGGRKKETGLGGDGGGGGQKL